MLGLAVRTSISLLLLATTGCFTDEPSAQTGDDPTGGDCPAGSAACACYGNGTCDAGLTCYEPGVCANSSCVAGQDQCPCDEATCAPAPDLPRRFLFRPRRINRGRAVHDRGDLARWQRHGRGHAGLQ